MQMIHQTLKPFPKDFLWGASTSAYQVEGASLEDGKGPSFQDTKKLPPGTADLTVSVDHYHRYKEDIALMAEMGFKAYRFSISWSRVLPDGIGKVNPKGIEFYNNLIDECLKYGIEPIITMFHFDMPAALEEKGSWSNASSSEWFKEFARVLFGNYGDRVKYWVTINEPNYETLCCYGYGNYPPNVQSLERRWRAMYHMMLASARAVSLYRELGNQGMIGLVSDSYPIVAGDISPECEKAVRKAELFFNLCVNDVCVKGSYPEDFLEQLKEDGYDLSYMLSEDLEVFAKGTVDYLGINAYNRYIAEPCEGDGTNLKANNKGNGENEKFQIGGWFSLGEDKNMEKTPWGMEICPQSIYDLLMTLKELYPRTPVIITENGVGNYDEPVEGQIHDAYRIDYLNGYVDWIEKAMEDGCDVRGYFVWSTMDVYSWINGYKKRYGLVYIDYDSEELRRIPKDSYYWYKNKIQEKGMKFHG